MSFPKYISDDLGQPPLPGLRAELTTVPLDSEFISLCHHLVVYAAVGE